MINPAKAASEFFLTGSENGEHRNSLSSLFTKQVGKPANYNFSLIEKITADYSNTEFRTINRTRPSSAPPSALYSVGSLKPALNEPTTVFDAADRLHAQRLSSLANATLNAFSINASGEPSSTTVNPSVSAVRAVPSRPQAPVSYAALEIDMV